MSEFILVTEFGGDEQLLINTEDIIRVTQTTVDGEATTYLYSRIPGYSLLRIRESVAQVTMLLYSPIGRYYAPTALGGYSSGPVPVGPIRFI